MVSKKLKNKIREPLQFGKAELKRSDMLRLKSEFTQVRENGTKYVGRYMLLVTSPPPDSKLRFGIICGKKYSKKAVSRNRARRLLKEAFRLLKNRVEPAHCIFIARVAIKHAKMQEVQKDMLKLLGKARIWQEENA
jgi:ribonuclease P protein component